jgi:hypothetical protein
VLYDVVMVDNQLEKFDNFLQATREAGQNCKISLVDFNCVDLVDCKVVTVKSPIVAVWQSSDVKPLVIL